MESEFFLYSRKHTKGDTAMWWKPDDHGYTFDLLEAGRYTAKQIAARPLYYANGERTVPLEVPLVMTLAVGERHHCVDAVLSVSQAAAAKLADQWCAEVDRRRKDMADLTDAPQALREHHDAVAALLVELGNRLGHEIAQRFPSVGFTLLLHDFGEGGFMHYLSSGERDSMMKALRELLGKIDPEASNVG